MLPQLRTLALGIPAARAGLVRDRQIPMAAAPMACSTEHSGAKVRGCCVPKTVPANSHTPAKWRMCFDCPHWPAFVNRVQRLICLEDLLRRSN